MNSRERVATSLAAFTACLLGTVCSVQAGGDATWDGGYIGSFIGGGTGDVLKAGDLTAEFNRTGVGLFSGTDELNGDDVSGLLTGGVVGQNFQRGGIVYGWEADLTLADIDATQSIATAVADPPRAGNHRFPSGHDGEPRLVHHVAWPRRGDSQ